MILGILGAIATGARLLGGFAQQAATTIGTGISTFATAAREFGGAVFEGIGGVEGLQQLASQVAPLFIQPTINVNEQTQLDALGVPIQVGPGVPTVFGGVVPGGVAGPILKPGGGVAIPSNFLPGGVPIAGRTFLTPGDSMGLLGQIAEFLGQGQPLLSLGPNGNGGVTPTGCAQMFKAGGAAIARPQRLLVALNPMTGRPEFWEHKGRPVLYSSDLRAAKRVRKIARKARSASRSGR